MADRTRIIALIREHGLDALPRASKDGVEIHARQFAAALRAYAASCAGGNLGGSDSAWNRLQTAMVLYGPGLVEALASALVDASEQSDA